VGQSASSDRELVAAYNAGDERALQALAERHYSTVVRHAAYRVRDPEAAGDIAQEVFLRVTRALPRFRGDAEFKTWLHCITVRACIDHIRGSKARPVVSTLDGDGDSYRAVPDRAPGPDAHAAYDELARHIHSVVGELPDRQRRVFRMRHYDHMKLRDIAHALDRSVGTVKAQLFTARSTIREGLDAYLTG
jgi:RNA polymerase sigma-70 factor, ECF subfamily